MREKEERAVAALRSLSWASGIVSSVTRGIAAAGDRFELRFAYELHLAGISPKRPFRAGVDNTDIDFQLPAGSPWNIELVSVNESEAIQGARTRRQEGSLLVEELDLGLTGSEENHGRISSKRTPEQEMARMISKLLGKVWERSRPVKFPLPNGSAVNMLLVDVRSYLGGDGSIDEVDCWQMVFGPAGLSDIDVMHDPGSGQPLRGIWDPKNGTQGALAAKERIHVVGFVHEEVFEDDEIRQVTHLFKNPALAVDWSSSPLNWPLPQSPRTGLRAQNALWHPG